MMPYLKGFHLTIEMWRGGRDAEGWKLKEADDSSIMSNQSLESLDITRAGAHGLDLAGTATYSPNYHEDEDEARADHRLDRRFTKGTLYAPSTGLTPAVPRLKADLAALRELSRSKLPPLRVIRPTRVVQVFYGFGDAAGKGFGATVANAQDCRGKLSEEICGEDGLRFRVGIWTAEEEKESSNWKEFRNLVDTTEEEAKAGQLQDCEFFLFTDNSTSESCFYRGNSSSPLLHKEVVRLRRLEMDYGLTIWLIHVAGTRMIAQGTDGCSRGFLMEGVMAGTNMLMFVDLANTAFERHPPLLDWFRSWTENAELEPLTPEGWFEEAHGINGGKLDQHKVWMPLHCPTNNLFLWAPPPAAADAALEELLKSRHKRTDLFHVVVIPRLMNPRWRRLFNKVCDFSVVIPPSCSFWPITMFEPLWLGIVLPFIPHRPWCLKRAPKLVRMGIALREMLPSREEHAGNLLRELLRMPKWLATLPQGMARGVLHVPGGRYLPDDGDCGRGRKPLAQKRAEKEAIE